MNIIEIERDRQESWHEPVFLPPVSYTAPRPMTTEKRMAFVAKLAKNVKAQYRHRPITELAANAILAEKRHK